MGITKITLRIYKRENPYSWVINNEIPFEELLDEWECYQEELDRLGNLYLHNITRSTEFTREEETPDKLKVLITDFSESEIKIPNGLLSSKPLMRLWSTEGRPVPCRALEDLIGYNTTNRAIEICKDKTWMLVIPR